MLKDATQQKLFLTKQNTIRSYLITPYQDNQAIVIAGGVETDKPTCLVVILGGKHESKS